MPDDDPKSRALRADAALNPHPEAVSDALFRDDPFFDARDVVQVRYEMLRRVRVDGRAITRVAADFGVSRPTYYEAQSAFEAAGLPGLLPQKRGPRGRHKLRPDVLAWLRAQVEPGGSVHAAALARDVESRFGVVVHPRSIERALAPVEKKRQ